MKAQDGWKRNQLTGHDPASRTSSTKDKSLPSHGDTKRGVTDGPNSYAVLQFSVSGVGWTWAAAAYGGGYLVFPMVWKEVR